MKRLAAAFVAFGLFACAVADSRGNPWSGSGESPRATVALAASALARMYETIDDAQGDAYVARTLLDPSQTVGSSEGCIRSDNTVSSRPSALANPPLAAASIAQRTGLFKALVAYEIAMAALTNGARGPAAAIALADLQREVFDLGARANQHGSGDLFIEDASASLATAVATLTRTHTSGAVLPAALAANPAIVKLIALLSADVARSHAQALASVRLDYERWLAYYETLAEPAEPAAARPAVLPLPRCLAPALTMSGSVPVALRPVDSAAFPGSDVLTRRLQSVRDNYDRLQRADPSAMLASLSTMNDRLVDAVRAPADTQHAAAVQRAMAQFSDAATVFARQAAM